MDSRSSIAVVIPTFRELDHVRQLISDLSAQESDDFGVVVVNSAHGDETTTFLHSVKSPYRLVEQPAPASAYWAGAVRRGIQRAFAEFPHITGVLVLNCDIRVPPDIVHRATQDSASDPWRLICYAARSRSRYVTSGVRMRSWILSLTRHLPSSTDRGERVRLFPADMLAGRALLIPRPVITRVGLPNDALLPHYGADYEFTHRAARLGAKLSVSTAVLVGSDVANTGARATTSGTTLGQRMKLLWSKRSPSNVLYRARFVWLVYPWFSIVPGLISILLKTAVEMLFGPLMFRLVAPHHLYEDAHGKS